ncbi:BTAD domain-containing putative transcriptional regulator [Glycomyces sp. NPDC046736]|uniref:BTAD domain-containing putative transcriptional regulator n=1 Tax=Glycomyces sp. NPDC046736 TaxID=3155615 RepID=UPI00340E797C
MTRIITDRHRSDLNTPVRLPSLAARMVAGIIAGLGLCALLVGVPFLFLAAFGWPPPLPSESAWTYPHLFATEFLISALALAAWSTWAWLAVIMLREAVHALRWGINPDHLRDAASPVRWLAGALIGAVAALWPATSHAATAPAESPVSLELDDSDLVADNRTRPVVWRTDATTATLNADTAQAVASEPRIDPATGLRVVTVGPENPTLWDIAAKYLGDGSRYMEIFDLNQGRDLGGGDRLTQPWVVLDGWELLIPDTEAALPIDQATGLRVVTVGPQNPTLWDIAEKYLGDPMRYMEIFELNKDRDFPGGPFDDPDEVQDGWQLLIPNVNAKEDSAEDATPPAAPDGEGEIVAPPTIDPVEPDEDDIEESEDGTTSPPPSTDPQRAESESSAEPGQSLTTAVPFGVWLAAGTCLAAGVVVAIAHRLRSPRERISDSETDEVMTGRLSDLEAIIESEARKLAQPLAEPDDEPILAPPVIGVSTDRMPITLSDLAAEGVGLRGPGQRGAARAAILTATIAGAHVLVTEAADLRLELGTGAASAQLHFILGIADALHTRTADTDLVMVCADTDLDETTQPLLEQFLTADGASAFILGDWIPSSLVLTADGTVRTAHGRAADAEFRSLHIADLDTTATVLAGLTTAKTDTEVKAATAPTIETSGTVRTDEEPNTPPNQEKPEPTLRLCLFGQPDAYLNDHPIPLKKGRRSRAFLTVLACAEGPVTRDELLEGVVGDMVEIDRAKNNFSAVAIDTRRALRDATGDPSAEFYTYDRLTETYELERHRFAIDLDEFNDAEQAAALTTDPTKTAGHLEAAIALYSGDLAPEVDTDTVERQRQLYRDKALRILERLVEHYSNVGDTARAEDCRARASRITGHR